ncbi:MAG: hypothetical protein ACR2LC_15955 [Pyrinomonadaceae bacterium]
MIDSTKTRVAASHIRFTILFALVAALVVGTSGCAQLGALLSKKRVGVPPLLAPLADAKTSELEALVNRMAAVRSIDGKVDIQFQDTSFAETGISEKYRATDGTVIVQRPGQIYLTIQAPVVNSKLVEMTSDGERFRVAVLAPFPGGEKYKSFLRGTNNAVYDMPKMDGKKTSGGDERKVDGKKGDGRKMVATEERAASVLSNVRPQHFTDALLIKPVETSADSRLIYAQSEIYQEEPDTRPKAGRGARVVRGYYLLDELTQGDAGTAHLLRRFWFDRVSGIRLARLQTFDDGGGLTTDVALSDPKPFGEGGRLTLPSRVEVTRPREHYKLRITYQAPEAIILDKEFKPQAFVLENTLGLREIDLDARQQNKRQTNGK